MDVYERDTDIGITLALVLNDHEKDTAIVSHTWLSHQLLTDETDTDDTHGKNTFAHYHCRKNTKTNLCGKRMCHTNRRLANDKRFCCNSHMYENLVSETLTCFDVVGIYSFGYQNSSGTWTYPDPVGIQSSDLLHFDVLLVCLDQLLPHEHPVPH